METFADATSVAAARDSRDGVAARAMLMRRIGREAAPAKAAASGQMSRSALQAHPKEKAIVS